METYGAGVVVFLYNSEYEILIGKRKGSHGAGTWSLPGGKIEFNEPAMKTISRELAEETGIFVEPRNFKPAGWIDSIWIDPVKGPQHWITLYTTTYHDEYKPEPRVMEAEKCEEWRWITPMDLIIGKFPLFTPLENYLDKFGIPEAVRTELRGVSK